MSLNTDTMTANTVTQPAVHNTTAADLERVCKRPPGNIGYIKYNQVKLRPLAEIGYTASDTY